MRGEERRRTIYFETVRRRACICGQLRLPDGNCPSRWQSEDKMTPMYGDLASAAGDSNNNQLKLGERWTIDRINNILNIQIMF